MHRDWRHDVSDAWLRARKPYVSASGVARLLADSKKIEQGKLKLEESMAFARLYGESRNMDVDTASFGAAARGHVLEPYAVDEWNRSFGERLGARFEWWDDKVIAYGDLAFSPDALDVPQLPGTRMIFEHDGIRAADGSGCRPTAMLEVKSYEVGSHFQRKALVEAGRTDKLDELWQVACGMAACPTIKTGYLMFYAPQANDMFYVRMGREGKLARQMIPQVKYIARLWGKYRKIAEGWKSMSTEMTEGEIYDRYRLDVMTG